ncbi:hypothetical protein MHYP_G00183510 [Metynnis hypsauchen]
MSLREIADVQVSDSTGELVAPSLVTSKHCSAHIAQRQSKSTPWHAVLIHDALLFLPCLLSVSPLLYFHKPWMSDPRLQPDLSFGEFIVTFDIYRDVLCQVYPEHWEELDRYLAMMVDISQSYERTLFIEYHE